MSYIKFLNSSNKINAKIIPINEHIIEVQNSEQNLNGFTFYLDNGLLVGHYEDFKYLYKQIDETTYQYSNDGSVYIEPEPIPEPIPELTEEELAEIEKQKKISELQSQILSLKYQLSENDYIIIKLSELSLVGETSDEYDMDTIHAERELLRTQINDLQSQIDILKG